MGKKHADDNKRGIPKVDSGYKDTGQYLHITNQKFVRINYGSDEDIHPELEKYISEIVITKRAFINKLDLSVSYVNYFIEYFDDDMSLLTIYLTLMFSIMKSGTEFPMDHFIGMIESLFSEKDMVKKITDMVEHNVDESMIKKKGSKHNDSLQLDTNHLKAILAISVTYKMIIPLVSHYYYVRANEIPSNIDEKNFYFLCFSSIIPIFDEFYGVKIYNKFYHTASTRVSMITRKNKVIWDRLKNEGITPMTQVNDLIRNLFVDITQKTVFTKSSIAYIHVCFDRANVNLLRTKTEYNYSMINMANDGDDDEITPLDSLAINNSRISIKDGSIARAIIHKFIQKKCDEYGISITPDMRAYYLRHYRPTDAQVMLVFNYIAANTTLGIQNHVKMEQFIDIMIVMKEYFERINCMYLQYMISGDYTASVPKRINKKKLEKYMDDYEVKENYTFAGKHVNRDKLFDYIKSLISTFVILDYELHIEGKLDSGTQLTGADEGLMVDELFRYIMDFSS